MAAPALSRAQATKLGEVFADPQIKAYVIWELYRRMRRPFACWFMLGVTLGALATALALR
jgi:hypothetical protein